MWGGHWSWNYWQDDELKPKQKETKSYCPHDWVDKPLFSHIHKMCDKCGMYYSEWMKEQSKANGEYHD